MDLLNATQATKYLLEDPSELLEGAEYDNANFRMVYNVETGNIHVYRYGDFCNSCTSAGALQNSESQESLPEGTYSIIC